MATVAVLLVGVLAAGSIQLLNQGARDRRDAAQSILEVEAGSGDQIVALGLLADHDITQAQFAARVQAAGVVMRQSVATLAGVDPDEAAVLSDFITIFAAALDRAEASALSSDSSTAAKDAAALDHLHTQLEATVDSDQARLLAAADRANLITEVSIALVIVASIALTTWVGARATRRRQRLDVVEAEANALRRSEETFRLLFESNPQPMYVVDVVTLRLLAVNETAVRFYGYDRDQLLEMTLVDLNAADTRDALRTTLNLGQRTRLAGIQMRHLTADGRTLDVEVHSTLITYEKTAAELTLVVDISERSRLEGELRHQAFHDSLTGLANRALFLDRVTHAIARDGVGALLLLGLDGFKKVNDSLGHNAGDDLLVAVGMRLTACMRPGDTVARLGGDEFGVLIDGPVDPDRVGAACARVLDALAQPVEVGERALSVSASIGAALLAGDHRQAMSVLREADLAMYVAKAQGRGQHRLFHTAMYDDAMDRLALEQDLREALASGRLRVAYQPKVEIATGRATAAEALVRWEHPVRGMVPPDRFVALAEEVGLITALDTWVLETACTQAAQWIASGVQLDHVAVNISGRELEGGGLLARVNDVLRRSGLAAKHLELEVTESSAVHQTAAALTEMRSIRELGVTIAIDDFGTGYSMLSRLQEFPIDRLKIDKSFIDEITAQGTAPLVAAMIAMGHELGLEVIAEGVETVEQLAFLRRAGCDQVQGYLLSKPVDAATLATIVGHAVDVGSPQGGVANAALQSAVWVAAGEAEPEHVVRVLLTELARLTGLETTYLTRVDTHRDEQEVLFSRNVGALTVPEDLRVSWAGSLCTRVLSSGTAFTRSAQRDYPDSPAAQLGMHAVVTVPVRDGHGHLVGTLCGASSREVEMGDGVVSVMELFAGIIAAATRQRRVA